MANYLALFELHDNEATGAVFHFCSDICRNDFETDNAATLNRGVSTPINHSQCDECGLLLAEAPVSPEERFTRVTQPSDIRDKAERILNGWAAEEGDLIECAKAVAAAYLEVTRG